MKQLSITILLSLVSMFGTRALAHNFQAKNVDGVTIYYVINDDQKTVSVSCRGEIYTSYSNEYSGKVIIPSTVKYNGKEYTVTGINNGAFFGCNVTYVYIPNTVTLIKTLAFSGSSIKSIRIPSSMTYIYTEAFMSCNNLTYVVIGNTNTSISDDVFKNCGNLKDVYCYSKKMVDAAPHAFGQFSACANVTLHAPSTVLSQYQNTYPWNYHCTTFVELMDDDPRIIGDTDGNGDVNASDVVTTVNIILGK